MSTAAPLPTGVPGVFLFPPAFESVVAALRTGIEALGAPDEPLVAPPVIARSTVERSGYVRSFPHLLGTVHSFGGDAAGWGRLAPLLPDGDWHREQRVTDLVLAPAACYHVYPLLAGRTLTGPERHLVHGTCFRQEATAEPGRLRSFRMSEAVFAGPARDCLAWRTAWLARVAGWLRDLGLAVSVEVADDPFFGPGERLMRGLQREQELKWELRVPLRDADPLAVASCNYHADHMAAAFDIRTPDGPAHTACVAFGLERMALALVDRHGSPDRWLGEVAARLPAAGVPAATAAQDGANSR